LSDERRVYQRLNVGKPIDAWFGDWAVRLIDVSATGALLQSDDEIPADARGLLRFWWRNEEVELTAETVRRDDSFAGVHFLETNETLRRLIAQTATEVLRAQQANAEGDRGANIIGEDETLTAASAMKLIGFVAYTLKNGRWKKRPALTPDQPENGFTVAVGENEEQVALLCSTYEQGDDEARRLTRLLAELSVGVG
jgi:hypothetical protein